MPALWQRRPRRRVQPVRAQRRRMRHGQVHLGKAVVGFAEVALGEGRQERGVREEERGLGDLREEVLQRLAQRRPARVPRC